jgi:hypothetical protein
MSPTPVLPVPMVAMPVRSKDFPARTRGLSTLPVVHLTLRL